MFLFETIITGKENKINKSKIVSKWNKNQNVKY